MTMTRRAMLRGLLLGAVPVALRAQAQDGAGATADSADRLYQPDWTGRTRDTLTALDNDPVIIATERRMRCTCGCTLDIYTCRTTDFTCTFSPALHREVVALYTDGKNPEEIIATGYREYDDLAGRIFGNFLGFVSRGEDTYATPSVATTPDLDFGQLEPR